MLRLVAAGPADIPDSERSRQGSHQTKRPARPLSAAPDDVDPAIDLPGSED
jgi:cytochrome d ubiquinol oxidase subunit I